MNDGAALMRNFLLWGVPFAVVVVALGYETNWGRDVAHEVPAAAASAPQPVAVALLPEYRIDDRADARKETVARELFNPTRRPGPPATQASAPSNAKHGLYLLTGTTVSAGYPNDATLKLNQIQMIGTHNSYHREPSADAIAAATWGSLHGIYLQKVVDPAFDADAAIDALSEMVFAFATQPRIHSPEGN